MFDVLRVAGRAGPIIPGGAWRVSLRIVEVFPAEQAVVVSRCHCLPPLDGRADEDRRIGNPPHAEHELFARKRGAVRLADRFKREGVFPCVTELMKLLHLGMRMLRSVKTRRSELERLLSWLPTAPVHIKSNDRRRGVAENFSDHRAGLLIVRFGKPLAVHAARRGHRVI